MYGPSGRGVADDAIHVVSQGRAVLTQIVQVLITQVYQLLSCQGDQVTWGDVDSTGEVIVALSLSDALLQFCLEGAAIRIRNTSDN